MAGMSTTAESLREHGTAPKPEYEKPTVTVAGCVACGQIHRGINQELHCLRAAVVRLRPTR